MRIVFRAFHSSHMLPTVYILTNYKRGSLYVGVTSDPERRLHQHRTGTGSRFADRYQLLRLVYFENPATMEDALARERQLKNWHRAWKIELIESVNPEWKELLPRPHSPTRSRT